MAFYEFTAIRDPICDTLLISIEPNLYKNASRLVN